MSDRMSTGEAIKLLEKRIVWIEGKFAEWQERGRRCSYFRAEIEANKLAIKALKLLREENLKVREKERERPPAKYGQADSEYSKNK